MGKVGVDMSRSQELGIVSEEECVDLALESVELVELGGGMQERITEVGKGVVELDEETMSDFVEDGELAV